MEALLRGCPGASQGKASHPDWPVKAQVAASATFAYFAFNILGRNVTFPDEAHEVDAELESATWPLRICFHDFNAELAKGAEKFGAPKERFNTIHELGYVEIDQQPE